MFAALHILARNTGPPDHFQIMWGQANAAVALTEQSVKVATSTNKKGHVFNKCLETLCILVYLLQNHLGFILIKISKIHTAGTQTFTIAAICVEIAVL